MKVASILKTKGAGVVTVPQDTTLSTIVWDLRVKGIGAIVVSDDGVSILGIVSERDVVVGLTEHGRNLLGMRVADVMNRSVVTCAPEDTVTTVMGEMTRHRTRHVLVVDGGRLCGIVSIGDVVKHRLGELELETSVLREAYLLSH